MTPKLSNYNALYYRLSTVAVQLPPDRTCSRKDKDIRQLLLGTESNTITRPRNRLFFNGNHISRRMGSSINNNSLGYSNL